MEDAHIGLACEILFTTGRRIGELLSLSMVHCEEERDHTLLIFQVEKKRGVNRNDIEIKIPLNEWQRWCTIMRECGAPEGRSYFFSRKRRGTESYEALLARYIRVLVRLEEIEPIRYLLDQKNNRFHLWRHSYVYTLYKQWNMDIMEIHQAIAHESIDTTIRFYGNWIFPPERRFAKWWED